MICKCGGVLDVIKIEEPPADLNKQEKLLTIRFVMFNV